MSFEHLPKLVPEVSYFARPHGCVKLVPAVKMTSTALRQALDEVRAVLAFMLLSESDGEATASGIELRELIASARNAVGFLDWLLTHAHISTRIGIDGESLHEVTIPWHEWRRLASVRNNLHDAATTPHWTNALVPRLGRGP